ncbi:MAG TPA: lytic transglycosylase domain-containing protein [Noviherbaspirillum sp.]|nr:lytic transglycosylase domain-containing protein [Noviherbaspirillum sp.]
MILSKRAWQPEDAGRNVIGKIAGRFAFIAALLACLPAWAGNQKEEALADSVRIALHNAITDARPPKPQFSDINERIKYLHWLGEMSERLKKKLPDRHVRREFLETVWYEARRAGLEPALVLGLIQVESAFRKYAVSHVGAHGYMQVMPFWTRVIGDGDRRKLFHMQTNLRYGCSILRLYLDMEGGNLFLALGRYNGSRGRPEYPNAVLAAWKRWEFTP